MGRRKLLTLGLMSLASEAMPLKALAAVHNFLIPSRTLSFYNTHTGERLKSIYWSQGRYLPEALQKINTILRDHRNGEVKAIDTRLLDLLFFLKKELQSSKPFHVISGFRSLQTNEFLRKKGRGVAKHSLHLSGQAIDIRLPERGLKELRHAAVELHGGGVGYYPALDFVHVDVGRIRYW